MWAATPWTPHRGEPGTWRDDGETVWRGRKRKNDGEEAAGPATPAGRGTNSRRTGGRPLPASTAETVTTVSPGATPAKTSRAPEGAVVATEGLLTRWVSASPSGSTNAPTRSTTAR